MPCAPPPLAGLFSSFKGAYTITLFPPASLTYVALLTLRHPNISASFRSTNFHLAAQANPATATTTSTATTSTTSTSSTTPAPTYDLLTSPRFTFTATLPALSIAAYGGQLRATTHLADILRTAAVVPADAVSILQLNSTNGGASAVALCQVWFPAGWQSTPGAFAGYTALEYFALLLRKLPTAALSADNYPAWPSAGATVVNITTLLPSSLDASTLKLSLDAAAGATTSSGSSSTGAVQPQVIAAVDISKLLPNTTSAIPVIDVSKIVDTVAPVVTLTGAAYVEVLEASSYSDAGATVTDNIDGNALAARSTVLLCSRPPGVARLALSSTSTFSCSSRSLVAVNTSAPNDPSQMYLLNYTARDTAGNAALPVYRAVVVTARCAGGERWCASLQACSTGGLCLARTTSTAPAAAPPPVYKPPADTTPPVLTLRGSGLLAITARGISVMIDEVQWRSAWSDPGATAVDNVDGNVSSQVQSYGAGAVDTSRPTAAGQNFSAAVQYYVQDAAGNAAPQAQRLIKVVCPAGERYCEDDEGLPWCTVKGICGVSLQASTGSTASSTGSTSTSSASSSRSTAATAAAVSTVPNITLLGPSYVEVQQLAVYDRCAANAPIGAICDRGASASDDRDGNLDRFVLVCGAPLRPAASTRPVPLLLACNITTDVPGTYQLNFTVTNSARATANVSRAIRVVSLCSPGEVLCPDRVSCSADMVCLSSLPRTTPVSTAPSSSGSSSSTSTGSTSSAVSNKAAAATAAAAVSSTKPAATNQAPAISLITTDALGPVVYIRQGSSYQACGAASPTPDLPCEPGATASDPDPPQGSSNLTDAVVVCPPAECFTRGCSPAELRRHRLSAKGLAGCPVNAMAAVGTTFQVGHSSWWWSVRCWHSLQDCYCHVPCSLRVD